MRRLCLLAAGFVGLLLLSALTPSAHAYYTPEQVIFSNEFMLPPSPREAEQRVSDQNRASDAQRQAVYDQLAAERDAAAQADSTRNPEPAQPVDERDAILQRLAEIISALDNGSTQTTGNSANTPLEQRTQERLLARLQQPDIWPDSYGYGSGSLAGSGPGTTLALVLLAGVALWTVRRATQRAS